MIRHANPKLYGTYDAWRLPRAPAGPFVIALVFATIVHVPFAPGMVPEFVMRTLLARRAPVPLPDGPVVVPIDLDMGFEDEALAKPDEAPKAKRPAEQDWGDEAKDDDDDDDESASPAKPAASARPAASAQPQDAKPAASATPPAASASGSVEPVASAPPVASSSPPPPPPPVEEPTKLAGAPAAVQSKQPNVMIYIATDVARRNELGEQFGALLAELPQWKELIGGTKLDPVKHFDHVWLSGPHMHRSNVVVAVIDYNIGPGRMQQEIETAMAASKPRGKWLTADPVPIGTLGDKASQRVSLRADKHVVIVAPAEAEDQLRQAKDLKFNKSGDTLIAMTVREPWRGFMNTAVNFPKTISVLRLTLTPHDESFSLRMEAQDALGAADASVQVLAEAVETIRPGPVGSVVSVIGIKAAPLFAKPTFKVDGTRIRMDVELTRVEVKRIMKYIGAWLVLRGE
jgi:hypothetical protein